ncbi:hypothetical protein O181_050936 [Austropuccinia psidii MF-1]|uniref:Uncharacterized protein n=1 Tax=Austropuccinia psidii MF-1 TaxID=1389203 RepID=A0A9Q3E2R9_9BASI|nr:hypothetical protein [Austropuccinia psidii MF-1]
MDFKYSFAGPFTSKALNVPNSVQLESTGELISKHPAFPITLMKPYSSSNKELFPLIDIPLLETPLLEEGEEKKIFKVLKERRTRKNKQVEYLVSNRNPAIEDEWLV